MARKFPVFSTSTRALLAACAAILWSQQAPAAGPCDAVVDDTVAEMRAGADGWWSQDLENLLRAAAGSACIKARSQRYAGAAAAKAGSGTARQAGAPGANSGSAASGSADVAASPGDAALASDQAEDGKSFSLGGLTFRSMSGSPAKKPYERARDSKDAEIVEKKGDEGSQ